MDKKLSSKQIKAIDLLVHRDDLNQKQVCSEVGVHEATLWRWLQDANFCNVLEDEQRKYLNAVGVQALKIIKKLADDEDTPPNVKYQAAKDLADRSGYRPTEKIEQTGNVPVFHINVLPSSQTEGE
jgi:transcriptional regulator with XRE-family HTH domain